MGLGVTALCGYLAWSTSPVSPVSALIFGIFGALGLLLGLGAARRFRRERTLAFELVGGQRLSNYELVVRLSPRSSLRLTRVTAALRWVQTERIPGLAADPRGPADFILHTASETLFEGSTRLGHGETFVRNATFGLPAKLRWRPVSQGGARAVHAVLVVRVEVDGAPYLEHEEIVTIEIQRDYETLSQT